ncbi:MAG: hypothetical protein LIQ30_01225 [Planctomycetes bacterium]|nr:hypothetical protein [Planctomycetota bacterium]
MEYEVPAPNPVVQSPSKQRRMHGEVHEAGDIKRFRGNHPGGIRFV